MISSYNQAMSNTAPRCAVITVVADDEPGFELASSSVNAAAAFDLGGFGDIVHIRVDDPGGTRGMANAWNLGLSKAADAGAEWVAFLEAGHQLVPNAFQQAAPALSAYDGVWGALGAFDPRSQRVRLVRDTIPAFQDLPVLLHRLRDFWLGSFRFTRLSAELEQPIDPDLGEMSDLDHLLRFWHKFRCLKTAQIFSVAPAPPEPLSAEANLHIDQFIFETPLFVTVRHEGRTAQLRYTGQNAILETAQLQGRYFEQASLEYLADRMPADAVILDVGANTGNHAIFFSLFMDAKRVTLFEPNPLCIAFLREALEANDIDNVDISLLGIGLGAADGMFAASLPQNQTLGGVHLKPSSAGDIQVRRLDDVVSGPVDFIKIDVEKMEIDVLAGAMETIRRERPLICIEVMDENLEGFQSFLQEARYKIDRIYPELTFANYIISPI